MGADIQEATSPIIPIEVATQIWTGEPADKIIFDFVKQVCVVYPEPSQGT